MPKIITLTDDYFTTVDDKDFAAVNKFNWFKTDNNKKAPGRYVYAAKKNTGPRIPGSRTRNYYLHRFIMERMLEEIGRSDLGAHYVQHIDGNGLNNRRANLVLITEEKIEGIRTQSKRLRRMKKEVSCL